MAVKEAMGILNVKQKVISNRRYNTTTLALEQELRHCEITRCLTILGEIDD